MSASPVEAHLPAEPAPAVLVHLGAPAGTDAPDLTELARTVERLIHTLAPDVVTRISVALPATDPGRASTAATGSPATAEAALRLVGQPAPPAQPGGDGAEGTLGAGSGLELDLARRVVRVDGREASLTRREFDLLAYLHQRRGVALSRRELMARVWGSGYLAGDRTVDVHVRRVRVKLGRHADRLRTLRGYGYRFD